jgi:hypothetical protein
MTHLTHLEELCQLRNIRESVLEQYRGARNADDRRVLLMHALNVQMAEAEIFHMVQI